MNPPLTPLSLRALIVPADLTVRYRPLNMTLKPASHTFLRQHLPALDRVDPATAQLGNAFTTTLPLPPPPAALTHVPRRAAASAYRGLPSD